jgi:hypothetical protein
MSRIALVEFFQATFVDGVAFQDVIVQNACRPDAELGAPFRVDPVADGDNGVEVVESGLVCLSVSGS